MFLVNDKLDLILEKLDQVEANQTLLKTDINEQFNKLKKTTNERFDTLGNDVSVIKESVLRIEQGEPKNITAVLKQINNKLDEKINSHEEELTSMNLKVSDLESDLKLIKRVLTNQ